MTQYSHPSKKYCFIRSSGLRPRDSASETTQTCQPSQKFDFTPGVPEYCCIIPDFFTSRSMRCVIVVRVRDFKINSNSIRIHTHTRTACSILYLCPARDVKVEKRMCVHKARAHQKLRYHALTINIYTSCIVIMSRPKASHTLTPARA